MRNPLPPGRRPGVKTSKSLQSVVRRSWILRVGLMILLLPCVFGCGGRGAKPVKAPTKFGNSLHPGRTTVGDTGVSFLLPAVFDADARTATDNSSALGNLFPFGQLPGVLFSASNLITWELDGGSDRDLAIYCFAAAFNAKSISKFQLTSHIQDNAARQAQVSSLKWEPVDLGGCKFQVARIAGSQYFPGRVWEEAVSVSGVATFSSDGKINRDNLTEKEVWASKDRGTKLPGRTDIYLLSSDELHTLFVWRAPDGLAEEVGFFSAVEAAMASVQVDPIAGPSSQAARYLIEDPRLRARHARLTSVLPDVPTVPIVPQPGQDSRILPGRITPRINPADEEPEPRPQFMEDDVRIEADLQLVNAEKLSEDSHFERQPSLGIEDEGKILDGSNLYRAEEPVAHALVTGTTNLPHETRLSITVAEGIPGGFLSREETTEVDDEGSFSYKIQSRHPLENGRYHLRVTADPREVTDVDSQSYIGFQGEHLKGPLVRRGTPNTIYYQTAFEIGGADAVAAQRSRVAQGVAACENLVRDMKGYVRKIMLAQRQIARASAGDDKIRKRIEQDLTKFDLRISQLPHWAPRPELLTARKELSLSKQEIDLKEPLRLAETKLATLVRFAGPASSTTTEKPATQPSSDTDTARAMAKLNRARALYDRNAEAGRELLRSIISDFPGTAAAQHAEAILQEDTEE